MNNSLNLVPEEWLVLPLLHEGLDGLDVLLRLAHPQAQVHHHAPDVLHVVPDACNMQHAATTSH